MTNVLVTGANRGIGLALCQQMAERGDQVWGACRATSKELNDLGVHVLEGVDVSDSSSVQSMVDQLAGQPLDYLINNAGILAADSLQELDFDAMEQQFRVNSLGPLRVTRALLGQLGQGSRVGIITSRMGSIADNTSGGYYGYRMSKAAVNMAGMGLHQDLREQGILLALLHPGMVATSMTGGNGVPVPKAAAGLLARMDGLTPQTSGRFWHAEGQELPW